MRCLCCCRCSCSSRSSTVRTHIRPSSYRDVAQLVVGAGARSGLGGGGAQRRGRGRWRCAALRGAVVVSSHFVARSDFFVTMSVAWPVGCQTATKPCPLSHVHTHCLCLSVSSSFFFYQCAIPLKQQTWTKSGEMQDDFRTREAVGMDVTA